MEKESLGLKSFKGVLWNVFGKVISQSMGFAMGIVLARMIAPRDYGLIAIAMVVVGITSSIIEGGFGAALIRKMNPTAKDYSTVFWINIVIVFFLYLIIYLFAPGIEAFYDAENLTIIIRFLAIGLILSGLTSIQYIQLTKKLNFKVLNIIALISTFFSGAIGISMALNNYGVWALLAQQLSNSFINGLLLVFYNKWIPSWSFSRASFRELFAYSSKLFINNLFASFFSSIYPLIIGKRFNPTILAYYNRAQSYQNLLSYNITIIVQKVTLPALTPIQDDNARLNNAYRQVLRMLFLFNTPAMLGLMVVAEPLIEFLITDKWLPAVPFLQLLCLSGLIYPLYALNLNIFLIKGRTDLYLAVEVIKYILIVISVIVGINHGVLGLVIAKVIFFYIAYFVNSFFLYRQLGYNFKTQFKDLAPYFLISIIMAISIWSLSFVFINSTGLMLLVQLITGMVIYIGGCYVFKLKAFTQFVELLKAVVFKPS